MSEGLFLSVQDFDKLPNAAKLTCLYENQVRTFDLIGVQKKTNSKIILNQRIQYGIVSALIMGVIFLIKHAIEVI